MARASRHGGSRAAAALVLGAAARTRSLWPRFEGEAAAGEFTGTEPERVRVLVVTPPPVEHVDTFRLAWVAFTPETDIER